MTPTPTVDGDEQLREKIDDLIEQYDILFVTVDGRASFENGIVALIKADKEQAVVEAQKQGQRVGQYQAADKLYGHVTHMWLFKDDINPVLNNPARATNMLKDCEKYLNHNRKAYEEYLKTLTSQSKQKKGEME